MDDCGASLSVSLDAADEGNVALVATIDNTSPSGARLINSSKMGLLDGMRDSQQFLDIVNS
jgi:hypothetical protein